jgi:hypothetical protein
VSQESTNRSFDDLARALAEGSISRRGALKLFAGSALAALIPSRALADDDDCVRVCHVPFDREREECDFAKAETRCVSRSRRRRHLENHPCDCRGRCANCLTSCLPNGASCTADTDCCSELVCKGLPGQRTCADSCIPSSAISCSGDAQSCSGGIMGGCTCVQEASSEFFCTTGGSGIPCTTSCDCPSGQFCQALGDVRLCAVAAAMCPVV